MRTGLVTMTACAHDARIATHPADSAGVRCKLPGQRARTIAGAPSRIRSQPTLALTGVD